MPTVAPLDLNAHCLAAAFLGDVPFFALVDGTVHWLDHGHRHADICDGAVSASADPISGRLLIGGEDGKVGSIDSRGETRAIASLHNKWINSVAAGPRGSVAYGAGRSSHVVVEGGKTHEFAQQRTVEGLAFAPKGMRLAVARYNGVSLHWVGTQAPAVDLEWTGAHTGVVFSPDGAYVVSTMQENALHGWRLKDNKDMRMSGYPVKVKSLSWSAKGKWLATSGAPAAIVWPFTGKDGPMGKAPLELGTRGDQMVTCVACHPSDEVVAIGYTDGMVLAIRFGDQKEAVMRRGGNAPISSMAWNSRGVQLAFGSEAGECGVIDLSA
ncbi:WD40 repeat domain-containing protein [Hoeflea sp. CAU 1731]